MEETIAVLNCFLKKGKIRGITELAEDTGLSRSDAGRIICVLAKRGYVVRRAGKYALT